MQAVCEMRISASPLEAVFLLIHLRKIRKVASLFTCPTSRRISDPLRHVWVPSRVF